MPARKPFTDEDIENMREMLEQCKHARREMNRAERVGVDMSKQLAQLEKDERQIASVIHEYADASKP